MSDAGAPLGEAASALREGRQTPTAYLASRYDRIEAVEPSIRAWARGPKPREQVAAEAAALAARHPSGTDGERASDASGDRPPLFGVPVGVKDIVHVDGLPTAAGSDLPPGELVGAEAAVVRRLRAAGAFVAGKTVTTEFAWMDPGPTRNPRDTDHTPGGSSSGSAAAVAAGMVPLAVGSQTIGSVIRPAAFCGVVGYKPSYGRIPTDGVVPLAPAVDHVGLFTQDVDGMALAASVCVDDWREESAAPGGASDRPRLGVPDGPYLEQASTVGREQFESHVDRLESAGYDVERVVVLEDIEEVNERHGHLVAAEAALSHAEWFDEYGDRYADSTADLIRRGRSIPAGRLADARRSRGRLRERFADAMDAHGIDAWIAPAAPGTAPEGIDDTGDPVMNLPWTHAGLPTVSLPAGEVDGLPLGLQVSSGFGTDERLLAWSSEIRSALS